MIVILILAAALFAANLDYPAFWNRFADWANPKVEHFSSEYIGATWTLPRTQEGDGYSLGLDLQGGVHLVYEADLSDISPADEVDAMASLRDAIERRVNFLGVTEPVVQVERGEDSSRLIVELAGIDDPNKAIEEIGKTPLLEFKESRSAEEQEGLLREVFPADAGEGIGSDQLLGICSGANSQNIATFTQILGQDPCYAKTQLTGQYLERATVTNHPQTGQIQIALQFNEEGSKLFEEITERNVGDVVAIYLDGAPVSIPVVNQTITGGQAVITGNFTLDEARELTRNLNAGALPVPIHIISQQRIGAALGEESLNDSLKAGIIALLAVFVFLIIIYRLSGFLAVISLGMYLAFLLAIIKLIPITLTLAGIAGLILSIGMAVDANVLIFERLKEELDEVESLSFAVDKAFSRAWPSIRDGNISTLLTAAILFWFSTSFIQGFALTLGLGIVISLFSAMIITKYLMKLLLVGKIEEWKFIWSR
ncbi:MAG: protein translocase subunit SecD [Candidatus Spechtbacterales bacterium]|nr:protein translocase subunit SecD [Candidatus Spechtbacterales bacterium]